MTQQCPRCGKTNNDGVRFCTSCGNPFAPESPAATTPVQSVPQEPSGKRKGSGGIVIAGIVILAIIIALVFLQVSGVFRIIPGPSPAVTLQATTIAASYVMVETPVPEPSLTVITAPRETTVPAPTLTPVKAIACPSDQRACNGVCVNLMSDPGHCGDCNVTCNEGLTCQMGKCTPACSFGQTPCFNGCYNLSYDSQNCGSCGNSCPVGLACNRSICGPTLPTTIPTYTG